MYKMQADFRPANEKKNGYIGKANLTIADGIKINGISVFEQENGGLNLRFPGYDNNHSYVYVPHDSDGYKAMVNTVEGAVLNEQHTYVQDGDMNPYLSVKGTLVDEPYADGRFSVEIKNLCTLNGITTRVGEKNDKTFTAVNMPTLEPYENREGKKVYPKAFEGKTAEFEKDGQPVKKNYRDLISNLVKHERNAKMAEKAPLGEQMQDAKAVADRENKEHAQQKEAPAQGMDR